MLLSLLPWCRRQACSDGAILVSMNCLRLMVASRHVPAASEPSSQGTSRAPCCATHQLRSSHFARASQDSVAPAQQDGSVIGRPGSEGASLCGPCTAEEAGASMAPAQLRRQVSLCRLVVRAPALVVHTQQERPVSSCSLIVERPKQGSPSRQEGLPNVDVRLGWLHSQVCNKACGLGRHDSSRRSA